MSAANKDLSQLMQKDYEHGFVTQIESESLPPGLNEDVIRWISAKKKEPAFMLEWRLKAFRHWQTLKEPHHWPHIKYDPIDYQAISYFAAPKSNSDKPKSLDDVDPEILETYRKLGIPLKEQEFLAGVTNIAVDAVFDSISVATTFKAKLAEKGIVFCPLSEALQTHP